MPDIQISTLFNSPLFHVDEYRSPYVEAQVNEEEWTHQHGIAFVMVGSYLCHRDLGHTVANPNHALFFNHQAPYQIQRPFPAEEHTVEIVLKADVLFEMIQIAPNSTNPDRVFCTDSVLVTAADMLRLHQLLRMIESDKQQQVDELAIEELALALIADTLEIANQLKPDSHHLHRASTNRAHQDLAQDAKLVISEQFRDKLSLEEIAKQVHSSTYHLSRVFKKQIGLSLYQYLQQMRLSYALNLLLELPKASLSTLALDLGFASHSHFSTVFTSTFGMTPSTFRQSANHQHLKQMSKNLKA